MIRVPSTNTLPLKRSPPSRIRLSHAFPRSRRRSRGAAGASLYDPSPDGQPVIGEIAPNIFVDAGTSGHGFKIAPCSRWARRQPRAQTSRRLATYAFRPEPVRVTEISLDGAARLLRVSVACPRRSHGPACSTCLVRRGESNAGRVGQFLTREDV